MARIVVGVDGSAGSARALEWAVTEARLRGAELHVVHCWMTPYLAELQTSRRFERLVEQCETAAELVVDDALRAAGAADLPLRRDVTEGSAAEHLVGASRGADLLVVGSRGRGGFPGLLLGSVSQQCLLHAHCPVVVVPGAERTPPRVAT